MSTYTQDERSLKLTTPLGPDALIPVKLTGREAISELFEFTIEAVWQDRAPLDFKKILGKSVTVEIAMEAENPRYINGIVQRISQGAWDRERDFTTYILVVVPSTWVATRNVQIRIFQQKSVPDIISAVLSDLGLTSTLQMNTTADYQARDYTVQYYESDFAFISRLMEYEGIFYFYQHQQDSHTLVIGDARSAFQDLPGGKDIEFEEILGGTREDRRIFEWMKKQEIRSGKYTVVDWNFETPHTNLQANTETVVKVAGNDKMEIYENPGDYMKHDAGDSLVKVRMQEEETPAVEVGSKSWHSALCPGYKFNLKHHFADDGEYLLTSVQHHAEQALEAGEKTHDSPVYDNSFACIPANVNYRPRRITPIPRVRGVQTAIVVGPSGEEIYCDTYGRVKVQFHWDRQGKYDDKSSCWIRVASHWAGAQWGAIHIPRIGQEVIVDFVEGDVDRPIIVGSVYNAEQMPPYTLPDNKTMSGIRSRSSKNAGNDMLNEIRFEDKNGAEDLFMQAQYDMDVRVKHDRKEWVGQDDHLTVDRDYFRQVKRDEQVTINRDLMQKIQRDQHVKIAGKSAAAVDGSYSLSVTGDVAEKFSANHSEQCGTNLYLKAGTNIVIEAGVGLTLKVGGNFINIGPAGVFIQGTMVYINSGGAAGAGMACNLVAASAAAASQMPITTKPTNVGQQYTPGSSSSGGGAGSSSSSGAGSPSPGPTHDPAAEENKEKTHYVAIQLVDDAGQPLAGEAFEITLPDGSVYSGTTDEKGQGRAEHIDPGSVDITFPNLDKDAWEPA